MSAYIRNFTVMHIYQARPNTYIILVNNGKYVFRKVNELESLKKVFKGIFNFRGGSLIFLRKHVRKKISKVFTNIDFLYNEGISLIHSNIFSNKKDTPILPNALGDSAGVFGAALLN